MTCPRPYRLSLAAALALALAGGGAAQAQVMPDPDLAEVARTPLRDLNIDGRDIPEPLQVAARDPYATDGLVQCDAIVSAIAELDMVLGADYDIAEEDRRRRISQGRVAQSVVGSIIPFRGVLREVTGAAERDRVLVAAYTAGMVRRSFLKGWGLGQGCQYPARPKALAANGS